MKIGTTELKTKPATKYFDHGYISFSTVNKELFYKVTCFESSRNQFTLINKSPVKDVQQLEQLLKTKTIKEIEIV